MGAAPCACRKRHTAWPDRSAMRSPRIRVPAEAGPQVGESDVRELMLELSDRVQPGDIVVVVTNGREVLYQLNDIFA